MREDNELCHYWGWQVQSLFLLATHGAALGLYWLAWLNCIQGKGFSFLCSCEGKELSSLKAVSTGQIWIGELRI